MSIKKNWKIYLLIVLLIAVLAVGFWQTYLLKSNREAEISETPTPTTMPSEPQTVPITPEAQEEPQTIPPSTDLPSEFLIANVPFQPQAPFGNWDAIRDEACEEAVVILSNYFLKNKPIDAAEMDSQIVALVDWQQKNWGGHFDINTDQMLEMAEKFYGLKGRVIRDTNMETLKREIVAGNPVIVPAAGRLLGNPYFRAPGPVYHTVLAIGYNANNIITQEVGTRRGDHYEYNQRIFENAWHDWNGSYENMTSGAKNLLVLSL